MQITEVLLYLFLFVPLVVEAGHHFAGDKFARWALRECRREVGTSVNKTDLAYRPAKRKKLRGKEHHHHHQKLHHGKVVKAQTHQDARKLHFGLTFPSEVASKLARSREVLQCVLDKIEARLHPAGTTTTTGDACSISPSLRQKCGGRKITKFKCVQHGCCYNANSPIPCYHPIGSPNKVKELEKMLSPETMKVISNETGCTKKREEPDCSDLDFHRKYRTIDGTCNNLANPIWGATLTKFRRILPAMYEDGLNTPRGWTPGKLLNGFALPSARLVSSKVLLAPGGVTMDKVYSYMMMQWAQFVNHDTDIAPTNPSDEGFKSKVKCAHNCKNDMPCFPIPIPKDDPRIKNSECMGFTRSASICTGSVLSPREQLNEITTFIDASVVYGSTREDHEVLRDPVNQEFLVWGQELFPGKFYLPVDNTEEFVQCEIEPARKGDSPCFRAGDKRVNEQIGLTMMHTVWHREHNRIAAKLKHINPQWDPETVFQEARKILIGEFQVITFDAFLPKLLGDDGLKLLGEYTGYNPSTDPTTSNSYISAALRFGHAMIHPEMPRLGKDFQPIPKGNLPLHKCFFAPHLIIEDGGIDPLIHGFLHTPVKMMDAHKIMNSEIIDKLFQLTKNVALDLGALNIQRGRDHGLPPYTHFRDWCGLKEVNSFEDLRYDIRREEVRYKLQQVYGHVDNIDLFAGGLAEDHVGNSRLGPTFLCLVAEQFKRLRDGDRFFYRNPDMFTPGQLAQLRNATLARVMCDNGDYITHVQKDAFLKVDYPAGYSKCDDDRTIPIVDLWEWEEPNNE